MYTATISDQNQCSIVLSETILAFDCVLALETSSNIPACFQGTDGSISVEVIGGTLPITYLWSTGDTSTSINNLSSGIYSLTVTDFADCVSSVDVVLEEPSELVASGIVVNPTCAAICNGSVDLDISGGTGPYNISWSNGLSGQTITDLCEGLIAATITDEMGCVLEVSFTLEDPLALDVEVLFEDLDCEGSVGTMMWVEVENDQNGYTVNWLPGNLTSDTIEIEDLDYTVIVITGATGLHHSLFFTLFNFSFIPFCGIASKDRLPNALGPNSCLPLTIPMICRFASKFAISVAPVQPGSPIFTFSAKLEKDTKIEINPATNVLFNILIITSR